MKRWMLGTAAMALAVFAVTGSSQAQLPGQLPDPPTPPTIAEHIAKAKQIAGDNPYLQNLATKGFWCSSPAGQANMTAGEFNSVTPVAAAPIQIFDNVYMIGTIWDGVIVLKTSDGLVIWDTLDNSKEVRNILIPGLKSFGLDPKDIKLAIVTHAHFDHFGGAKYLQDTYHTQIGLSEADWKTIETTPLSEGIMRNVPPPKRDRVLKDGEEIKIGDATIKIVITPGHTGGTVSSVVPVKDHGVTHNMVMWGGTTYPVSNTWGADSNGYPGAQPALKLMGDSMMKLKNAGVAAGAVGVLDTHPGFFHIRERVANSDYPDGPNPLVEGTDNMTKTLDIMRECLSAEQEWIAAKQGS